MTLDEMLSLAQNAPAFQPREAHIEQTVRAAGASFLAAESARPLSPQAFLLGQLALIHKRWWLAQLLLLLALAWALPDLQMLALQTRSLGVAATLFVILIIPELAKNSTNNAMEIEGTTHYTLRHIYAARLLLFGGADLLLLSGFCGLCIFWLALSPALLVSQFLLPLVVTACLCFAVLTRKHTSLAAICACLFWSGLWWLLLLNERLYAAVSTPLWLGMFTLCLGFLIFLIRHWLHISTAQWEVHPHGTLYE